MPLESKKRVTKLLQILKHKWRISNALRSLSRAPNSDAANNKDGGYESDVQTTFLSADSYDLRSISTDNSSAELPSLRLSGPIFPTGILQRPPSASPVKIVKKLPFGYVIGRQLDSPVVPQPQPVLARRIKKVMAALHVGSRLETVKNKVSRALKRTFRRARRGAVEEVDDGNDDDDEDVFWKRSVRGLRCRPLEEEDDDAPY